MVGNALVHQPARQLEHRASQPGYSLPLGPGLADRAKVWREGWQKLNPTQQAA